jgi:dTDP-4-dehydrorhamnose reductase
MTDKLLILGIGGLTGLKISYLAKDHFNLYGSYNLRNPELNFFPTFNLDITNSKSLENLFEEIKPNVVINTIALSSVDYCEQFPTEASKLNVDFVKNLFDISKKFSTKIVHLSSDSVYDGTKKLPYIETDNPHPINVYGNSKLSSEKIILQNPSNLIVRASVLYGWLPKNIAFLESSSKKPNNFSQWLIKKLQNNENVKIITDEYSSPIIAEDFANSILYLIKNNFSGVFHSAPPIDISRYDFSIKLANYLNFDTNLIKSVKIAELGRKVKTGNNKSLDSSKLESTGFKFLDLNQSFELLKNQLSN